MELSAFTNLFQNLQDYVVGILNEDEILQQMGCTFLAENSLDIEFQIRDALNKQGMACVVMTPKATYQGHNGIQQTFTCDELTIQVVENPIINRARLKKAGLDHGTALDVAKQASDRLAGPQGGYFGQFTTKRIQEAEQGGLLVCTATFGCTVYEKLDAVISGDLSGKWVEVPFVRMNELSAWIDEYLSGHMPAMDGYLPLSGGEMSGDIAFQPNNNIYWGTPDGYDGRINASTPGLTIYNDAEDQWRFKSSFMSDSEYDVLRRMDLSSVEVPTKVSELSNDVGYITSVDVRPAGGYLSGWAYRAWSAANIYAAVQYGPDGNMFQPLTGDWAILRYEYNKHASTYGFSPQDWHLSYFNGQYFDPPITLRFGYFLQLRRVIGGRIRTAVRGWGWGYNDDYFIGTGNGDYNVFPGDPTPTTFLNGSTLVSKAITLSENGLSVATYDGQTGAITCTRDLSAGTWALRYIPYVDEVVPYYNTSPLTVTVPYDYGFTLQTPNGIPLLQTIDLNRTSINSLSTGNAEIGPDGSLVTYPGAGADTTKLSAWQWIKTGETGIGSIISSEHNAILGEVSEDYVSFNWLIQQGYATSAQMNEALSNYLPLSGGQMEGGIAWDYGGMGGPQIYGPFSPQQLAFTTTYQPDADKMVFLDFGRIEEAQGQRTIAFVEDIDAVLGDISALIHAT